MVQHIGDLGWKPRQHAPIYLELELPHQMPRAPRLIAPKKFPQDLPVGPVRAPPGVLTTTSAIFISGDPDFGADAARHRGGPRGLVRVPGLPADAGRRAERRSPTRSRAAVAEEPGTAPREPQRVGPGAGAA